MRPSEVCGIATDDFAVTGLLTLNRGYDRYGVVSSMKTAKSHRPIRLSKSITELLKNRISSQRHQADLMGEDYVQNDFLFKQEDGTSINPNVYSKAFKRCLRAYNQQIEVSYPTLAFTVQLDTALEPISS